MAWFRKTKQPKAVRMDRPRSTVPEGLWVKCEGCKEIVYSRDLDRNLRVNWSLGQRAHSCGPELVCGCPGGHRRTGRDHDQEQAHDRGNPALRSRTARVRMSGCRRIGGSRRVLL